ncbi:unnamed protein product [Protopolystoma xenopodis]|uniref:Uncharacterized protein n=1 Tax=Protopolystoma xenopodis TaxID=117903 RepID=A0A3S5CGZ2_9PLAT|nr:unnamed protein product [Protopolystoma xenopodis]
MQPDVLYSAKRHKGWQLKDELVDYVESLPATRDDIHLVYGIDALSKPYNSNFYAVSRVLGSHATEPRVNPRPANLFSIMEGLRRVATDAEDSQTPTSRGQRRRRVISSSEASEAVERLPKSAFSAAVISQPTFCDAKTRFGSNGSHYYTRKNPRAMEMDACERKQFIRDREWEDPVYDGPDTLHPALKVRLHLFICLRHNVDNMKRRWVSKNYSLD